MTDLKQAAQQALEALERIWEGGLENLSDATHERVMEQLSAALAEPQTTHWEGCEAVHPECRTTPRKPLTDDEIAQAMFRAHAIVTGPTQFRFAREIERAHGIGDSNAT